MRKISKLVLELKLACSYLYTIGMLKASLRGSLVHLLFLVFHVTSKTPLQLTIPINVVSHEKSLNCSLMDQIPNPNYVMFLVVLL